MAGTEKLWVRIQHQISELSPQHKKYVHALQTPESNVQIFQTLIESDQFGPDLVAEAMAKAKNSPLANASDIDPEQAYILGTGLDGVIVYNDVAYMVNPFDGALMRELQRLVEKGDIRYYRSGVISLNVFKDPRFSSKLESSNDDEDEDAELDDSTAKIKASDLIDRIIGDSYLKKATDIHISGSPKRGDVRIRVDGKIRPLRTFDISLYEPMSAILHERTKSQIEDPSMPHSADFEHTCSDGKVLTLRLESMEHQSGRKYYRKISLRILGAGGHFGSISEMGFTEKNEARALSVTRRPTGLFLVTGPTGSGKSTTLGSMMTTMYTAAPDKAYFSIEQPVEVEHKGIWQIPIKGNLTFEAALESAMRLDPDVIMVGEIRSKLTAELAIQASLTGHVVLATLHTNDAHGVIPRLKHFGVSSVDLAESLIGSSAQRLVPKLCGNCSQMRPFGEFKKQHLKSLPALDNIHSKWIHDDEQIGVRNPNGCDHCQGSGIAGRVSVFECFLSDKATRSSLLEGGSGIELRTKHLQTGSIEPLWIDGIRLLKEGKVSIDELFRILDESELEELAEIAH